MNCSICQEDSNDDVVQTDCGHSFHVSCITGWVIRNDTCPLCRSVNPCGVETYYYTLYYYDVYGLIDGYVFDPYQFYHSTIIRYTEPGRYSVFRRDFGGDTDTLPLDIEETIQHNNDEFQDENGAYDQWEHDHDHDY